MAEMPTEEAKRPTDPVTGRRRDQRSRAAILAATVELLGECGYQGLTMEGVAARASVGKATVYRWWSGKGDLVLEALHERAPLEPVPDTGDARADLRAAVRTAIATMTELPTGAVIPPLAADVMHDPASSERFRDFFRPRRASVLRILHRAAERGDLPRDVDAELLFDLYAGTIFYRVLISGEPVTDHLVDQFVGLLLDGEIPRSTR